MLAHVTSGAVLGVDAYLVRVEVDLARGLPCMNVVGLPQSAVREGRERVTAALVNSGFEVPPNRITINLAPADVRKEGSAFDLPIALGLLAATGTLPARSLDDMCCVGELGLDGRVRPVRGALPLALRCQDQGLSGLILPTANAAEAAMVPGVAVRAGATLEAIVRHLRRETTLEPVRPAPPALDAADGGGPDLADVRGQAHAKRALEIAAAGAHNLLLMGPPGAGKSMLVRRLPGIMPPMTRAEALELTKIHSVAGRLRPGQALVTRRPFRAPHHGISDAGLIGGGSVPRPGEVSLAQHGVLFLDELPEFRRSVLESLRQPVEDGTVHIGRARVSVSYPARFLLAAAMNPCPCGHHGDGTGRCVCGPDQVRRYRSRISGPLLDRIDLHVDVPALDATELTERRAEEPSAAVRERVIAARDRQLHRLAEHSAFANAHLGPRGVRRYCIPDEPGAALLRAAIQRLGLSARAYHRVLKLARTIADLAGEDGITAPHVAEAIQYRSLDRAPVGP